MKLFDSKEEDTDVVEGAPIGSTDEVGAIEKTLDTVDVNDPDAVQEVLAGADINIEPNTEKYSKEEDGANPDDKKEGEPATITDPVAPASDAGTDTVVPSEDVIAEKFEEEFETAQEALNDLVKLTNVACGIEARMIADGEMVKNKKLTSEHVVASIESFINTTNEIGYNVKFNVEALSFESVDGVIAALEALDGERQSVLARIGKVIANGWEGLLKTASNIDAYGKLLKSYNVAKLNAMITEIQSGARKPAGSYNPQNVPVSKKLAIYYSMGNAKFDTNAVIAHINLAYDLIVEKKLFTDGCQKVVETLLVSKSDEDKIDTFQPSVDVLDKFTLPDVRKWINKDTKAGLVSNLIGNKFTIVSVFQDDKGAAARSDHYTVPTNVYVGKPVPALNQADALKLLKAGVELGPKGAKMAEVGKSEYWKKVKDHLSTSLRTTGWGMIGGVFSIPRQIRQTNLVNTWIGGVILALLHLKKSHIDSGEMIYQIIDKMYPKA